MVGEGANRDNRTAGNALDRRGAAACRLHERVGNGGGPGEADYYSEKT